MTNLLGPSQTITTNDNTFVINETQFVGENGYVRRISVAPQLGLTSNGNINYKQDSTEVPMHSFNWTVVLPREQAYSLVRDIEAQIFQYKQNNNRQFTPYTLEDNKLAIIPEALPTGTTSSIANGDAGWVFPIWNILFTGISYEVFGSDSLLIRMSAIQLSV